MKARTSRYHETYARWQRDPAAFWAEAAREIDWIEAPKQVFDTQGRSVPATTRLWPGLLGLAVIANLLELVVRKWRSILPEKWQTAIASAGI